MKGTPVVLSSSKDKGQVLERMEVRPGDEMTEDWLQRLIFEHPTVLPASVFDDSFAPLIPLGREVGTDAGYIDNLYISPLGRITMVETKLWKNPEKHRTVVAQIIDYAKEVSRWDYDRLNEAVLRASRAQGSREQKSLDQLAAGYLGEAGLGITDFQERTMANLGNGEFLLLIVGDRISANVALLTEAIHGVPGLEFRLGAVELHLYRLNSGTDWPVLVIPEIVGRTVEVTRGIVKIQYVQEKPTVMVELSEEEPAAARRGTITPEVFLQKTPLDLRPVYEYWLRVWASKEMSLNWGSAGLTLRVAIKGRLRTILEIYPEWGFSLIRKSDADSIGVTAGQYRQYLDDLGLVPKAINMLSVGRKFIGHDSLTTEDVSTILKATTELGADLVTAETHH
ncbi:MAG: hypothetical protein AMJ46_14335 [Latescibacteria bacterium DG_63]|nr:MAG: hypothetical protein AMJ46_14335 [Latescibacteria bacterium DG_63]